MHCFPLACKALYNKAANLVLWYYLPTLPYTQSFVHWVISCFLNILFLKLNMCTWMTKSNNDKIPYDEKQVSSHPHT